jgi:hypothetical protein
MMSPRRFRRNPARHELDDRLDPRVAFATVDVVCDSARFRKMKASKRIHPSDDNIYLSWGRLDASIGDEELCKTTTETDFRRYFEFTINYHRYDDRSFKVKQRVADYEFFDFDEDHDAYVFRGAIKIDSVKDFLDVRGHFDEDGTVTDDGVLSRITGLTLWPQGATGPIVVTRSSNYEGKDADSWLVENGVPANKIFVKEGMDKRPRFKAKPATKAAKRPARTRRVTTARAKPRRNPSLPVAEMTVSDLYGLGAGGMVGRDEHGNTLRVWDYARMGQAWLCKGYSNGMPDYYVGIGKTEPEGAYRKIRLIPSDRSPVKTPRPRSRR